MKKFIIAAVVILLLTPLGLLAPGTAWGEWGLEEIKSKIGFVPAGMKQFSEIVKAILPDYSLPGFDKNFFQLSLGYIFSAIVGIGIIFIVYKIFERVMVKNGEFRREDHQ
ncbi:cobalt/nickel transport protein [Caldanaerobius fijiensis DSM 17918]|uniref:Cobalt/nickel transport protein n=1 Tax=Caldanaerobius fijiensis DSM 17918 TaxID=1121256 RepID=A0A1M5BW35_9THEO|nr:PDGLE domain-containing protein [Caldanaerobius fijiensis]SHF46606.1 cobalt/nickel transport protein [Caldanaerobius fijiensis DSM 17918]